MTTNYDYTISVSFPTGLYPGQLDSEIKANGSLSPTYLGLNTNNNILHITFSAALSGANLAILNGIIAAYIPAAPYSSLAEYYGRTVVNTSTYNILVSDLIVCVTYSVTGTCTVTLPLSTLVIPGKIYYIVDEGANAMQYNITITTSGGNLISSGPGSSTTFIMDINIMAVGLYSDGVSKWYFT